MVLGMETFRRYHTYNSPFSHSNGVDDLYTSEEQIVVLIRKLLLLHKKLLDT